MVRMSNVLLANGHQVVGVLGGDFGGFVALLLQVLGDGGNRGSFFELNYHGLVEDITERHAERSRSISTAQFMISYC